MWSTTCTRAIVTQPGYELVRADVDGHDLARTPAQQDVGEAARGRPGVQRAPTVDPDLGPVVQRAGQFVSRHVTPARDRRRARPRTGSARRSRGWRDGPPHRRRRTRPCPISAAAFVRRLRQAPANQLGVQAAAGRCHPAHANARAAGRWNRSELAAAGPAGTETGRMRPASGPGAVRGRQRILEQRVHLVVPGGVGVDGLNRHRLQGVDRANEVSAIEIRRAHRIRGGNRPRSRPRC